MRFNKKDIAAVVIVTSTYSLLSATAAPPPENDSEWIPITQNIEDTQFYSGKKGSFEITTTKSGLNVATIIGQTEDRKQKSATYNKWYVSIDDCDAGMGKLVVLKINGEYSFEGDFVSGGKNIASRIADVICEIYQNDLKNKDSKSI